MGFLDFLFDKETKERRKYAKLRKTLTNMYVQPSERSYAIQQLRDLATEEAVDVLLARYGDNAPNTTVDIEEKEYVYDVLVLLGQETDVDVVGVVREHLRNTEENVNWPMKVLSDLLDFEEFTTFLAELLSDCTTDYVQNPEKKQELILRATEIKDEAVAKALVRFLADANETIRFLAVTACLAQERDDLYEDTFIDLLEDEESIRIVNKLVEAFYDRPEWKIPEEQREAVERALPEEYGIHNKGHIYKHR